MRKMSSMVDMKRTPAEKVEAMSDCYPSPASMPDYPYGLSFCFTEEELDKLGLGDDVNVGDMIHINGLAKVTSVSKNENEKTSGTRVEMIMTHIAAEDEDGETEEADEPKELKPRHKRLYST